MDGFGGWYEDFWQLSTERQIGFGVGPIPQSRIDERSAEWSYEDVEMFEFCIREMDAVYMAHKPDDKPEVVPGPPPRFADLAGRR